MLTQLRPAIMVFLLLTLVTGIGYPFAVLGAAQLAFPAQANGSLITRDDKLIGSSLIGQGFQSRAYFWGRPSATSPAYNAAGSGGSNLGPLNPALHDAVRDRIAALRAADPENTQPVPVDLVTASGSGLDPHISVAAARYQAARVARARGITTEQADMLIAAHTTAPLAPILGEAVVNVLELNLALDAER